VLLANYGPGTHIDGVLSLRADLPWVIPVGQPTTDPNYNGRFMLAAQGVGGPGYIRQCTAGLVPLYILTDQSMAAGDYIAARILGLGAGTAIALADGVIPPLSLLVPSPVNAGFVVAIPATAGSHWVVGRSLNQVNTAQYDDFEFAPCAPYEVTVTS
jgi:hypothetical protein